MRLLLRAVVTAIAIFLVALFLPDHIKWGTVDYGLGDVGRYLSLLLTGAALGIVNAFIRPIVAIISLPLTCLTFGLFSFVINALLLMLVAAIPQLGFSVDGFLWALIGSILISIVSTLISTVVH